MMLARRLDWAQLLRRVFAVDVLVCDTCGGSMRILAVLPAGEASRAILEHLGLSTKPPLEHHLHARRTVRGGSVTLDDVVTGQSVLVNGDRLQLSIRTSQNGYLYLAFCSQHDTGPRYHGLSVFPAQGSLALTANVTRTVPSVADEIVLDDQPGRETIFVVSKTELSRADARLADILAGAQRGVESAECGSFQRAVTGAAPRAAQPAIRAVNAAPPPAAPPVAAVVRRPKPEARIERGVDIVLNPDLLGATDDDVSPDDSSGAAGQGHTAGEHKGETRRGVDADADGIVVLRYEFRHVAPVATRRRSDADRYGDAAPVK